VVLPPEPPPLEAPTEAPPPKVSTPSPPSPELLVKALRKILEAIEGSGVKAAAVGEIGHQVWGSKRAAQRVELLLSSGELQRETVLGAARGEGLQQTPGAGPLNLQFTDAKLGGTVAVDLVETVTPFHKKILARAQPGVFLEVRVRVATSEDLILLRAGSPLPTDRESVIELLRLNGATIDAAYLKETAKGTGVFDQLKSTWQQAKQQGG
jgi:predicted nucleotidyltransferase